MTKVDNDTSTGSALAEMLTARHRAARDEYRFEPRPSTLLPILLTQGEIDMIVKALRPNRAATTPSVKEVAQALHKWLKWSRPQEDCNADVLTSFAEGAQTIIDLFTRKSPGSEEVERLRERCLGYKGQVEAGSIAIQHLQGEIDRLRASPDSSGVTIFMDGDIAAPPGTFDAMMGRPQSDDEIAEMIAKFRTPPGCDWKPLRDDILTVLNSRRLPSGQQSEASDK